MIRSPVLLKFFLVWLLAQLGCAGRALRDDIQTKDYPCPIDEDILPCICTYSDDLTEYYLDCSEAKTVDELTNVFTAAFPFTTFASLTIDQTACDDCRLISLPFGVLGDQVSFQTITITGTNVAIVEEQVFGASHNTLTSLHLHANLITEYPFESLGDYTVLSALYLQNNKFDSSTPIPAIASDSLKIIYLSSNPQLIIPPEFVEACPSIERVYLRNGKLSEIPLFTETPIGMFTGREHISIVDFSANLISEILTNTIVAEKNTLTYVNLSSNNISILHPNFATGFSSTTVGLYLYLQDNAIVKLDQQVWTDVLEALPEENSVDLSGNPILCGCEIAWLVLSSPDLRVSLTDTTTCSDGVTVVKTLTDAPYLNC